MKIYSNNHLVAFNGDQTKVLPAIANSFIFDSCLTFLDETLQWLNCHFLLIDVGLGDHQEIHRDCSLHHDRLVHQPLRQLYPFDHNLKPSLSQRYLHLHQECTQQVYVSTSHLLREILQQLSAHLLSTSFVSTYFLETPIVLLSSFAMSYHLVKL